MVNLELELVEWLANRTKRHPMASRAAELVRGIGDDMSVFSIAGSDLLLSTDMFLDGTHFELGRQSLDQIAHKSVAATLSDCAAMAAIPQLLACSCALPSGFSLDDAKALLDGVVRTCERYEVLLCGGDTTSWNGQLALDIAVVAVPNATRGPVLRSGAQPNDVIATTGKLGGSRLKKHHEFEPRLAEAQLLAELFGDDLHALIDITDGLSLDLWRVCQASSCGAQLEEEALLVAASTDAHTSARQRKIEPLEAVLSDGEDFELLAFIDPQSFEAKSHAMASLWPLGKMTTNSLTLLRADGTQTQLSAKGWTH